MSSPPSNSSSDDYAFYACSKCLSTHGALQRADDDLQEKLYQMYHVQVEKEDWILVVQHHILRLEDTRDELRSIITCLQLTKEPIVVQSQPLGKEIKPDIDLYLPSSKSN